MAYPQSIIVVFVFCVLDHVHNQPGPISPQCTMYDQECTPCDGDRNCFAGFEVNIDGPDDCKSYCGHPYSANCVAYQYDFDSRDCTLYSCADAQLSSGNVTLYRKSCNAECRRVTLSILPGNVGISPIETNTDFAEEECLTACLDTPLCRAAEYRTATAECILHKCSLYDVDQNEYHPLLFVKTCGQFSAAYGETREEVCVNCAGLPQCRLVEFPGNSVPISQCRELCQDFSFCLAFQYDITNATCSLFGCRSFDHTSELSYFYRQTCNEDCTRFTMTKTTSTSGTCNGGFDTYEHDVDSAYMCISKCANSLTCNGVTLTPNEGCTLHNNCNTIYTLSFYDSVMEFYRKLCLAAETGCNEFQVCKNCTAASVCSATVSVDLPSCHDICQSFQWCRGFTWSAGSTVCQLRNCSSVAFSPNGDAYFSRKSCNSGCSYFGVEELPNTRISSNGLCDGMIIPHMSFSACLTNCLDTEGCFNTVVLNYNCYILLGNCSLTTEYVTGSVAYKTICYDETTSTTEINVYTTVDSVTPSISLTTEETVDSTAATASGRPVFSPTTPTSVRPPIYLVPCQCSRNIFRNQTPAQMALNLTRELEVDRKSTNKVKRKKESAEDERPSSQAAGYFAVCLMCVPLILFVLNDLSNLSAILRIYQGSLKKGRSWKKRHGNDICYSETSC